ncbi:hypothetical protein MES5069_920005 [Mesorhizobium escarrei]|uniref:YjeF N-terminal domain-containing protein n=1 Tax=Mesorhizobium escarrei TaxID=666018 RepID=A0ABM9EL03_9HYPH|nr:hypothetical protein MES5069_920005 [Mesorhizobium escarrei]
MSLPGCSDAPLGTKMIAAGTGLCGVKLVVSDGHGGLEAAGTKVLCAAWQRCRVLILDIPQTVKSPVFEERWRMGFWIPGRAAPHRGFRKSSWTNWPKLSRPVPIAPSTAWCAVGGSICSGSSRNAGTDYHERHVSTLRTTLISVGAVALGVTGYRQSDTDE